MDEAFEVCFKSATWHELKIALDSICLPVDRGRWHFPKDGECFVDVYLGEDMVIEYFDEDIARLHALLGDHPASILCVELRGSQGSKACYCAKDFVMLVLRQFEGIVYDSLDFCWILDEIAKGGRKNGHTFLDC